MRTQAVPEAIITHSHRFVSWICYLLIFAFVLRRIIEMDEGYSVSLALALSAVFTGLFTSQPLLSKRFAGYTRIYFSFQIILALALSLFQEYIDTVAMLYIVLGFQAIVICPRKEALVWLSLFIMVVFLTLVIEFGLLSGLGRAMAYTVIGGFFITYDIQYSRHQDALEESQLFLSELTEAHGKLEKFASQAEKLAAAQERERIIKELYDSVGQKIFAIMLAAEATRIRIQKDPRSFDLLDQLQEQTQDVLSQVRQLISQWRPG